MAKTLSALFFLIITLNPALSEGAPIEFKAQPGVRFTAILPDVTKLPGPYLLASGPEWLSVNSAGKLSGTPAASHLGDNTFAIDVKTGPSTWVSLSAVIHVGFPQYTLKVFSAPWCQTCLRKIPELENQLRTQLGSQGTRVKVELFVETGEDPYEAPKPETLIDYQKALNTQFELKADAWRWLEYRKWHATGFVLPSAVLLNDAGDRVKSFTPGLADPSLVARATKQILDQGTARKDIDLLWVVDNSGSMQPGQQAFAQAVTEVFSGLQTERIDWKMGVISTDPIDKPYLGFDALPFDASVGDAANLFITNLAKLGTFGTGVEQTFTVVTNTLRNNPTFLRPEAELLVVNVTDEDEQSNMTSAEYVTALNDLKPGRATHSSILWSMDSAPACSATGGNFNYKGSKFEAAVSATGGRVLNLCAPDLGAQLRAFVRSLGR